MNIEPLFLLFLLAMGLGYSSAWIAGYKNSLLISLLSVLVLYLATVFGWAAVKNQAQVASEAMFQESYAEKTIFVFVGDAVSMMNGTKTHITTLYIPGDKEYTFRFENIPPKGYKSIKTEDGQELYVSEKFTPPNQ